MKIITRYTLAAEAAIRWGIQYSTPYWIRQIDKQDTHRKLLALGGNPHPDDVDRVIGNSSWTQVPNCDECNQGGLERVILLGGAPDSESSTARICIPCLVNALRLVDKD